MTMFTLGMDDDDIPVDAAAIMASMGTKQQKDVDFDGLEKPWMKYHEFKVVQSVEELRSIVDDAFKTGKVALDLETEGLDTRVYMHEPDQIPDNVERPWGSGQPSGPVPLTKHKVVGYCLSTDGHTGYYIPVRHRAKEGTQHQTKNLDVVLAGREIQRLCEAAQPTLDEEGLREDPLASPRIKERGKVKVFFWNAKFDQEMLYPVVGIDFWHPESFEDGMLMYFTRYTADKGLSLKKKSKDELWIKDEKGQDVLENNDKIRYIMIELKELFPKGRPIDFPALDPYEARHYACSDAICTFLHCDAPGLQEILISPKYNSTYRLEKQVTQVVRVMERHRIRINVEYVRNLLTQASEEALEYRNQIVELAAQYGFHNFDPQSPKQLSEFLFSSSNGLRVEPKPEMNEKSGQYKTDADTLEGLVENSANVNPVLLTIVKYRQVEKVIGTYLESMINNVDPYGDLRYQWRQTGAATGRFSSPSGADMPGHGFGGVPMHGIPGTYDEKKPKVATCLREAFVAREGYIMVKIDYAGEELRIVTNLSGEPVWTKEFLHGTGDLHTITAKAFFGGGEVSKQQRQMGKTANFALVYGGGTGAVMRATGCNKEEGARRKQNFDRSVPIFAKWVSNQKREVKIKKGVKTAFGRWIAIPEVDHENQAIQASADRKSVNFPIQGCLQKSALVLTSYGWKSIESLASEGTFQVWTGTAWVDATACNMGSWYLAEVRLSDGSIIRCDTRHKVLQVTDEGYTWATYDSLEPGTAIATSLCEPIEFKSNFVLPEIPNSTSSINPNLSKVSHGEMWYWLGRYMGDGWYSEDGEFNISFGCHEDDAIDRCSAFFRTLGMNPKLEVNQKDHGGISAAFSVSGVDFTRWLNSLGFSPATAHTKRIPACVFTAPLSHRHDFLKGFMDSDGHKPPLKTAKGNPYNFHLCQRPLLEDTKLFLRALGIESKIRGPYRSGTDIHGNPTTSYRLDFNRRMFEREIMGRTEVRHPKVHDMLAPQFLVNDLLSKGGFSKKDFPDQSTYVMYIRLKHGGKVTVYTLKRMCEMLGVTLDQPIYGYKRVVRKEELGRKEDTYTLSVRDPLHRYEANGVIHKNTGADIMKIAMVKILKECYKRGWQDVVHMMLTVHDELVFEVKQEFIMQVMPVLDECMTLPSRLLKWKVPLIAEPLLGKTWDAKYDYEKMMHGTPYKEGGKVKKDEVIVNGRLYQQVPDWLESFVIPSWKQSGSSEPEVSIAPTSPSLPSTVEYSASVVDVDLSGLEGELDGLSLSVEDVVPKPSVPSRAAPREISKPAEPVNSEEVLTLGIHLLTAQTARLMAAAILRYGNDDGKGKLLRIVDTNTNEVLVSEEQGFRVNEEMFRYHVVNELNI